MYETILESGVMVPMRDGVLLATDIYRPALSRATGGAAATGAGTDAPANTGTGPNRPARADDTPSPARVPELAAAAGAFPVILERTPYDRTAPSRSERTVQDPQPLSRAAVASYFVSRGYVVIYQDCRGRYGSGGEFTKYLSEGEDGYDTIAWILDREWCDGRIGTMGLSYAAHTQMAAACLAPPGLAAMFVDSGGFSNAYQGGIRQGGAFELKQATWAYRQALQSREAQENPLVARALEAEDIGAWFTRMPWKRGHSPLRHVPEYENYLFDQWEHGVFDGYWKRAGICAEAFYDSMPDIPSLHMSSWYDPYTRTAATNYRALSDRLAGPVFLVLGPWTHGDRCQTWAGDVDFGPRAPLEGNLAPDFPALRLDFFDRFLKGRSSGGDIPRVRYFRMGGGPGTKDAQGRLRHGGVWKTAGDWPVPGSRDLSLFPCADGSLGTLPPPSAGASLSWIHDPAHPVPSIGGSITSGEPVMRGGAFDQVESSRVFGCRPPYLPLASRTDILVFQTPPLESGIEVTGPVSARLFVSSDAPDTDFTIKLIDVYPPSDDYPRGFAMNLCDGILRARYRDSWESPRMMEPGKICEILVEAFPTSNYFAPGHRIRLDVAGSNFPHFDVNPNSGGPEGMPGPARCARNTLHMDADHPSRLVLRQVPEVEIADAGASGPTGAAPPGANDMVGRRNPLA